ncbi:hypothetical protein JVT61DRAFT_9567 [Boletus reticuloceps]|uniref:Uncharacterized protein n=1 Tax=Boletus reticuloceps TaxID=495285 RepID=A0A8I3A6A7_9AGAM|nr:hypothetical protein JVT61DRAFT_9567 [Boletus reticuloceps]
MEGKISDDQMELDDESDGDDSEDSEDGNGDDDGDDDEMDEDRGNEEDGELDGGVSSTALVSEELVDEMDEFGYSGLDQEVADDDKEEGQVEEDGLGAEDGKNARDNKDEDEFFADL